MHKVLYCMSTLRDSGPTNQLINIISNLDKQIFELHLITLSPEPLMSKWNEFERLGVKLYSLNLSRVKFLFGGMKKLLKLVRSIKPDIIHTFGFRVDVFSSKYLADYNRVSTLRNYPYRDYLFRYGRIIGSIIAYSHLKALKQIECTNTVSRSVSEMLRINKKYKIDYIHNGVDLNKFKPVSNVNKLQLRKELNLPQDKKIFISVGHLVKLKDPLTVIKGFNLLQLDAYLIILGKGDLMDICKATSKDNPRIKLLGFVKEVDKYLQSSDYFISASLTEGLPNTVMEALAIGLPCILSNIEPHKEILEFSKSAGELFEVKNIDDLVKKTNSILAKNYSEISNSARKLIKDNLRAKIMSEKYQIRYLELLSGSKQ